jgi:hypothetical protein
MTYRPPQWSRSTSAMVSVTVPNSAALAGLSTYTGPMTYVFDAVLRLAHEQRVEKTMHPVQTGAAVTSHAYVLPARLSLSVAMSNALDSYAAAPAQAPVLPFTYPNYTPWTGASSKSVSAYQTMIALQLSRQPLTVTTRLRTYTNMLVVAVDPEEDAKTITGLRMRVDFEQVLLATASQAPSPNSARSDATGTTNLGQVNPILPDPLTGNQYGISGATQAQLSSAQRNTDNLLTWLQANPQGVQVPGAGDHSSVNVNNLAQLPAPQ